jgi:hypothetical protein
MSAVLLVGSAGTVAADNTAVIDEGTANARCLTSYAAYPPSGGSDPLSACQWDMGVLESTAANATALGTVSVSA